MSLTLAGLRNFVRAMTGQKDFANLKDVYLNQVINHSLKEVQQDLIGLGQKPFTKTYYATPVGGIVSVPTDLLTLPNAIIDVKAGGGSSAVARASTACIFDGGQTLTITAREPGTANNSLIVTLSNSIAILTPFTPVLSTNIGSTTGLKSFSLQIRNGNTTIDQLVSIFTTNQWLYNNFVAEKATGDTGTVSLASFGIFSGQMSGGTGNGWQTCEEVSIENFNRDPNNTYLAPFSTNVIYKRDGDIGGTQSLEFLPAQVSYALIYYHYRFADLTSDSDTSPMPVEYERLLCYNVAIQCYLTLKNSADTEELSAMYDRKLKLFIQDYESLLAMKVQDKTRMLSEDPRD